MTCVESIPLSLNVSPTFQSNNPENLLNTDYHDNYEETLLDKIKEVPQRTARIMIYSKLSKSMSLSIKYKLHLIHF